MNRTVYDRIKRNWDRIAKPLDGLGDFEEVICRIGAIQGEEMPLLDNRALVVMCADNGIVEEGVSQSGSEITYLVARALGAGTSTASIMAMEARVRCIPVDMGIDHDGQIPGVVNKKVGRGSRNFLKDKALTTDEIKEAVDAGEDIVRELKSEGVNIIAAGEMGIGNTTTAATLLSLLSGLDPDAVTGRGAGLDDDRLIKKMNVVRQGVERYKKTDSISLAELAWDYLSDIGGLEIAGMCGLFIGGMKYDTPVIIDGFISAVAAFYADAICPGCREYMIPSHSGRETGLMAVLDMLELRPLIAGDMALGEGTGAIMCIKLLDSALNLYKNGTVFEKNGIEEYKRYI